MHKDGAVTGECTIIPWRLPLSYWSASPSAYASMRLSNNSLLPYHDYLRVSPLRNPDRIGRASYSWLRLHEAL